MMGQPTTWMFFGKKQTHVANYHIHPAAPARLCRLKAIGRFKAQQVISFATLFISTHTRPTAAMQLQLLAVNKLTKGNSTKQTSLPHLYIQLGRNERPD